MLLSTQPTCAEDSTWLTVPDIRRSKSRQPMLNRVRQAQVMPSSPCAGEGKSTTSRGRARVPSRRSQFEPIAVALRPPRLDRRPIVCAKPCWPSSNRHFLFSLGVKQRHARPARAAASSIARRSAKPRREFGDTLAEQPSRFEIARTRCFVGRRVGREIASSPATPAVVYRVNAKRDRPSMSASHLPGKSHLEAVLAGTPR